MCVYIAQLTTEKIVLIQLGLLITNEIFPEAIDFFTGEAVQAREFDDSEDEDEEEDDEDEEEIDLEKPRAKKAKKA